MPGNGDGEKRILTPKKKKLFLENLARLGGIGKAAKVVGISRATVHNWKKEDEQFEQDVLTAFQTYGEDVLEAEADRRAVEGTDKPVFFKGDVCGHVKEYSDTLLIFRMKGAMPEKYKDRVEQEQKGAVEIIIKDMNKK